MTRRARGNAPTGSSLTYVYAVAQAARPPSAEGGHAGLPGLGPPRLVPIQPRLWLVVATAPEASYSSQALEAGLKHVDWVSERAVAHEAVIERFAALATVIPTKLFTLFGDDERRSWVLELAWCSQAA